MKTITVTYTVNGDQRTAEVSPDDDLPRVPGGALRIAWGETVPPVPLKVTYIADAERDAERCVAFSREEAAAARAPGGPARVIVDLLRSDAETLLLAAGREVDLQGTSASVVATMREIAASDPHTGSGRVAQAWLRLYAAWRDADPRGAPASVPATITAEELARSMAGLPAAVGAAIARETLLPNIATAAEAEVYTIRGYFRAAGAVAAIGFAIRAATLDPEIVWRGDDVAALTRALADLSSSEEPEDAS